MAERARWTADLTKKQVGIQRLIGSLKFIEKLHPSLSLVLHRLSCVMSCPPPEAWDVACAALATAYAERDVFGGAGLSAVPLLEGQLRANIDLEEPDQPDFVAHADATWGDRNVYGLLLMFAGAAVLHQTIITGWTVRPIARVPYQRVLETAAGRGDGRNRR